MATTAPISAGEGDVIPSFTVGFGDCHWPFPPPFAMTKRVSYKAFCSDAAGKPIPCFPDGALAARLKGLYCKQPAAAQQASAAQRSLDTDGSYMLWAIVAIMMAAMAFALRFGN